MKILRLICEMGWLLAAAVMAGAFAGAVTFAVAAPPAVIVSQKGRTFQPTDVSIKRGDTVQILNDDGDLLHHAYIESDHFNFDSGDQEPGSKLNIVFPVTGNFSVLCAIHPKMKLVVHVK